MPHILSIKLSVAHQNGKLVKSSINLNVIDVILCNYL